jgi:integrase/recombinase XerD
MKAYLEAHEVEKLEDKAGSLRDKLLIRLLFRLGCRISELLGLRIEDIDFQSGTLTIKQLKQRVQLFCPRCNARLARQYIFCSRCGAKVSELTQKPEQRQRMRRLPVDEHMLCMLKQFVEDGGTAKKEDGTYLFSINRHRAWQIVKKCAERAELPKLVNPDTGRLHYVSPHRLRDAFAVHAVKSDDSGDGLRMLQQHLGHQSIATTMRYRKVSGDEHRRWYRRLWEKPGAKGKANGNTDIT